MLLLPWISVSKGVSSKVLHPFMWYVM
jgi:hypothetical protein